MELTARIVTLRLAETFVIARESRDEEEVLQVELRHDGAVGYGEGAAIDRYEETAQTALAYVEEHAPLLGDDPFALEEIEARLPAGTERRQGSARRRAPRPPGQAARRAGLEAAGPATGGPADLLDRLARRSGRHGPACRRSGTHSTLRMPRATVPMCTLARSPSSRSATMRGSPVRKTSSGILRLVAKLPPGIELRPRDRAILNSSSFVGVAASMMNPRSAPLTSIAESSTSASTSSRTRPEPSARRPSRSAAIWRRSPIAVVVALSMAGSTVGEEEHHLGAAAAAEPDAVAVHERALGYLLAVDVGAVPRALVADQELVVLGVDLGVVARDFAAGQAEIVGFAPPDLEVALRDRHDTAAQRVGYFKAGIGHGIRNYGTFQGLAT